MPDYRWRFNNALHPNLICYYDMSTLTPGGLMKNLASTGSVYDGVINGTLTLANPLIRAKRTKCMDFDGATNYLSLANPINGLTAFTVLFWTNLDAWDSTWFSRAGAAATFTYINGNGSVVIRYTATGAIASQKTPISTTRMICTVINASVQSLIYIDGKRTIDTGTIPGANPADANAKIGAYWDNSLKLNGRLDNIMFFNVALDAQKINALFRSASPRM